MGQDMGWGGARLKVVPAIGDGGWNLESYGYIEGSMGHREGSMGHREGSMGLGG